MNTQSGSGLIPQLEDIQSPRDRFVFPTGELAGRAVLSEQCNARHSDLLLRGRCPLTVDPGCPSRATRAMHASHPNYARADQATARSATGRRRRLAWVTAGGV